MTSNQTQGVSGVVKAIAWRAHRRESMTETQQHEIHVSVGLAGEGRRTGSREVTLLSAEDWAEACKKLGTELPWTTRRTSIIVEGVDLSLTINKILALGSVQIEVCDGSRPCDLMDYQYRALRDALATDGRGGITGRVLVGGTVSVGDPVATVDS